ncbi:MAG: zinc ribbon domain-containing protein [Candidatus Neomarinimicrobiota bacterium]
MKAVSKSLSVTLLSNIALFASDGSPFGEFVVGIWPEYDRPGILVIYTGTIKSDYLPLEFETLVPDEVDRALAVGQSYTEDNLQPVAVEERSGRKWVTATLVRETFQLEFYYNPFGAGELRKGELEISLNHPLDAYHIAVQHPLAAEEFLLSDEDAQTFRDEHGLTYSRVHLLSLSQGKRKTVSFSYRNPNDELSIALLQKILDTSPGGATASSSSVTGGIPLLRYRLPTYQPLAVVGVLSVIIGYIFWRSNQHHPSARKEKAAGNFCPRCGATLAKEDSYCSGCGKQLS